MLLTQERVANNIQHRIIGKIDHKNNKMFKFKWLWFYDQNKQPIEKQQFYFIIWNFNP